MSTDLQGATEPLVVRMERHPGHIALVTIDRPHARNAVDGLVARQLEACVDESEADPEIWVVILTGQGSDAFCSGADLKEVAAGRGSTLNTDRGGFAGFTFRDRVKPWIAAVNGKALAGGMEITLACDLVVAVDHATFGLPEVLRGLIAAAGGLFRLPRAIPPNLAMELILTAGQLSAVRAHQYGLVNRLATTETLLAEALALASQIAGNAPLAVRESLKIARQATAVGVEELRAMTRSSIAMLVKTEDLKEGPRAFIEKREPKWKGY